jgi:hypothetical protein
VKYEMYPNITHVKQLNYPIDTNSISVPMNFEFHASPTGFDMSACNVALDCSPCLTEEGVCELERDMYATTIAEDLREADLKSAEDAAKKKKEKEN